MKKRRESNYIALDDNILSQMISQRNNNSVVKKEYIRRMTKLVTYKDIVELIPMK